MDSETPSLLPQGATPGRGLAIASLVLGIIGLCLSLFVVGAVLGLAGAAVGLVHVAGKRGRNGMAWWGVSLSVLSILSGILFGVVYFRVFQSVKATMSSAQAPTSEPAPPASALKQADKMLTPVSLWSVNLPGAAAICSGDWEGNGQKEILVASDKLHVLGLDGVEKSTVSLPDRFTAIECGRDRQKGPRLLGYTTWGHQVEIIDSHGNKLWRYSALLGVDGAHWVDLDGDGTDEMIVGMNGFGGLDAVSSDGKKLWHVALANVWSQAAISAEAARPAQVFATEAGGSVRSFDAKGQALRVLKPNGEYCTKLAAGFSKQTGAVQVLVLGQGSAGTEALAFDSTGQIAWSTPVKASPGTGGGADFASGDLMGDGTLDWAFLEPSGDLALATTDGKKVATIAGGSGITGFTIVSDAQGHGLLVVLRGASLEAFSFK